MCWCNTYVRVCMREQVCGCFGHLCGPVLGYICERALMYTCMRLFSHVTLACELALLWAYYVLCFAQVLLQSALVCMFDLPYCRAVHRRRICHSRDISCKRSADSHISAQTLGFTYYAQHAKSVTSTPSTQCPLLT